MAVQDELLARRHLPRGLIRIDATVALRYVAAGGLGAGVVPDLCVEPLRPSAPDRRVLLETIALEVLEQDRDGRLFLDGERVDPGALVAFGSAIACRERPIAEGDRAALLLATREPVSFSFRVLATEPVLWVFDQPSALAEVPVLAGWLIAAQLLCARGTRQR